MTTRRDFLTGTAALAAGLAAPSAFAAETSPFIQRRGTRFLRDGKPLRYVGANIWYGAYLGAKTGYGNRDRLLRELDALAATGVTNLRVLSSSEASPLKHAVSPSFRDKTNHWNPDLLDGLDFLLAEMAKRRMHAVLYLTNFWEWSGGMMTYLSYVNDGHYVDMGDPAHPWPAFPDATAQFYANPAAVGLYHDWIRALVGRTNAVTGTRYAEDPTIMAWQLANEPRPGGSDAAAEPLLPAFHAWVENSAKLIKSLDKNHLVCTGSEGLKGSLERAQLYKDTHAIPAIDYCTAHIWPLNWSWIDAKDIAGTHAAGAEKVADYIRQHIGFATELGKPLVIEEFGYPRDGGGYDPEASTAWKDKFYRLIYDAALADMRAGGPIAGTNFWAWTGEARAVHGDHHFVNGDNQFMGDPPHEPQGWYGVFDTDTTKAVIAEHAKAVTALPA